MKFRSEMLDDLPVRIIDFIGHLILAIYLPGPFWSQYLPELVGPICLVHGIVTNEILDQESSLIQIQNFLHTMYVPFGLLMLACFLDSKKTFFVCFQYTAHVLWDQLTHFKSWQKRSLWRW